MSVAIARYTFEGPYDPLWIDNRAAVVCIGARDEDSFFHLTDITSSLDAKREADRAVRKIQKRGWPESSELEFAVLYEQDRLKRSAIKEEITSRYRLGP